MNPSRRLRAAASLVSILLSGACAGSNNGAASADDASIPADGAAEAQGDTSGVVPADATSDVSSDTQTLETAPPPDAAADEWLTIQGNRILRQGKPFHGRGANLHDTRSCMACAWNSPDPAGLMRWSDELLDRWKANFVRFDLSANASPQSGQVQWKTLSDDPGYLADMTAVVKHMTAKPGVYVIVTLFQDPSMKPDNSDFDSEWPTDASLARYQLVAQAFWDDPHVLFGLTNEPHGPAANNAQLAARYLKAIDAIRAVETAKGSPKHHVIVVQAPQGWARDVSYFVANPIARDQIAYEVHPYNPSKDFDALITQPAKTLPLILGEYGPATVGGAVQMTEADVKAMWPVAQAAEVPYIAWNFHQRCPPNLLQDKGGASYDGCGLGASTGFTFARTAWGDLLFAHLQTPW